jgi:outer membrane protein OmpA-like peptidoglycan-associated protein
MRICLILFLFTFLGFSQKQYEVFFDFNKDFPNPVSLTKLNQWIADNKSAEITKVLGFCDSVDDSQYNKDLAMRRISNVLALLEKDKITVSDSLELKTFGEDFKWSKKQEENRKVIFFYFENRNILTQVGSNENESEFLLIVKNEKENLQQKFELINRSETIRLFSIRFYLNTTKIVELSESVLAELAQILKDNPNLKIEIQGHICCQFVNDVSGLSTLRAKAVYDYLVKNKIEKSRLRYKGYGNLKPIHKIPEQTSLEEQENRRVEILILEK